MVVEGKKLDIIFLDLSKAFGSVPLGILLDKLPSYEIGRFMLFSMVNWVNNWVNEATFCRCLVTSSFH